MIKQTIQSFINLFIINKTNPFQHQYQNNYFKTTNTIIIIIIIIQSLEMISKIF